MLSQQLLNGKQSVKTLTEPKSPSPFLNISVFSKSNLYHSLPKNRIKESISPENYFCIERKNMNQGLLEKIRKMGFENPMEEIKILLSNPRLIFTKNIIWENKFGCGKIHQKKRSGFGDEKRNRSEDFSRRGSVGGYVREIRRPIDEVIERVEILKSKMRLNQNFFDLLGEKIERLGAIDQSELKTVLSAEIETRFSDLMARYGEFDASLGKYIQLLQAHGKLISSKGREDLSLKNLCEGYNYHLKFPKMSEQEIKKLNIAKIFRKKEKKMILGIIKNFKLISIKKNFQGDFSKLFLAPTLVGLAERSPDRKSVV